MFNLFKKKEKTPSEKIVTTTNEPLNYYEEGLGAFTNFFSNLADERDKWQKTAYFALVLAFVLTLGLIYVSTKATFIPYVVHVDEHTGYVNSLGSLQEQKYRATDAQVNYFLSELIKNTRGIPLDPVLFREQWDKAGMFFTKEAFRKVKAVYGDDVASLLGTETVQTKIISIAPVANVDDTYQIRWEEISFVLNTSKQRKDVFSVIVSTKFETPNDKAILAVNPLGIYVTDISFNREGGY